MKEADKQTLIERNKSKAGTRRKKYGTLASDESFLTIEQEAYCRARAMGMSIAEAVTTSGAQIKPSSAQNKWERAPKIKDRIAELCQMATQNAILRTGLDREWVISRLMTVAERCMQAEPVTDKEGNPTGEYTFNASGANQALKMLGDTMGLFQHTEKKDEFAELSDEDLTRIIEAVATEAGVAGLIAGKET